MPFWEKWYFTECDGCSKVPSCAFSDQRAFLPSLLLFNRNKAQSLSSPSKKRNYTLLRVRQYYNKSSQNSTKELYVVRLNAFSTFCFQVQLLLQQIFGLFPPLFCHLHFCFVLPYVTREQWLCRVIRQATGLEGQSRNAMIIAGGCSGGRNNLIFKLIL